MNAWQTFRVMKGAGLVCAAIAFLVLGIGEVLPLWSLALPAVLVFFAWRRDELAQRPKARWNEWLWNILALFMFPVFFLDVTASHHLLNPVGRLIGFLMLYKLQTRKNAQDHRHLMMLSLLSMVAGAALTTEIWYFAALFLYVPAGLVQLATQQLLFGAPEGSRENLRFPPFPAHLRSISGFVAMIWIAGAVVFVALPRENLGWGKPVEARGVALAGFSDRMELGQITEVKLSDQQVFRAVVDTPLTSMHRWFGAAFDTFDGSSWSRIEDTVPLSGGGGNRYEVPSPGRAAGTQVRQSIVLEPAATGNLFFLPAATEVVLDRPFRLGLDPYGALRVPGVERRTRYLVVSRIGSFRDRPFHDGAPPTERDLQVPALSEEAQRILDGIAPPGLPAWRTAVDAEANLQRGFSYAINPSELGTEHPLETFLQLRRGYCEYFASALAIALRRQGIAARVVTGFLPGEVAPLSGQVIVRTADAHAWVEAWIPGTGWVTLDATPGASLAEPPAALQPDQGVGAWVADVNRLWDDHVIGFSALQQARILGALEGPVGRLEGWMGFVEDLFQRWFPTLPSAVIHGLIWLLSLGALLVLLLALRALFRLERRRGRNSREGDEVLRILAAATSRRGPAAVPIPHHTPVEALRRLELEASGTGRAQGDLAGRYARLRFGGGAPDPELRRELRAFRRWLSSRRA